MWGLDHKESWALKNWCFWTVVLEKTLESPLDCKEIKPAGQGATELSVPRLHSSTQEQWGSNSTWTYLMATKGPSCQISNVVLKMLVFSSWFHWIWAYHSHFSKLLSSSCSSSCCHFQFTVVLQVLLFLLVQHLSLFLGCLKICCYSFLAFLHLQDQPCFLQFHALQLLLQHLPLIFICPFPGLQTALVVLNLRFCDGQLNVQ